MEKLLGHHVKVVYSDGEVNKVKRGILEHHDDDFIYVVEEAYDEAPVAIGKRVLVSVDPNGGR